MKIIILGGFLGSGKTSVMLQIAKHIIGDDPVDSSQVVIIENEIGEISVDGKMFASGGYEVANMFSGCVCCTMSGELVVGLYNVIRDFHPQFILLEGTGVAYPDNIRTTILESMPDMPIQVTCVVDSKRWMRLVRPMEMLLKDQLTNADVILLNKTDAIEADVLNEVETSVRTFNDRATFYAVSANQTIPASVLEEITGITREVE
ncbi:cobalamin biosynthesis protein P47K [Alkalibacter rhizosphaerae]|uniref:Cobalamin biosynthesis protein P47K n=1 Tax=Alkalibacter rhizosphaerae TaxID=2815577 RepID=A0A974XFU2_9FIRM|nr:GTP-binding protein [Alkalibacter rhizosphaerae]QSX07850.1 cobalamin biosynthesis protein P47K [Alkalibacter rhizosphaerae]